MALFKAKKKKNWILKAVSRSARRVIAWVVGGRDVGTAQKLYDKLKHLKKAIFYTDDRDAFAAVPPKKRHVIGKEHAATIERNNAITRHGLARMTRRTIVVSKAEHMIDRSMKLFAFFEKKSNRKPLMETFQSIFV